MSHTKVLIVGAGPSGLFAACELARRGVVARVVEQAPERHRQARATALQPGTLEILEAVGLCRTFVDASVIIRGFRLHGPDMRMVRDVTFGGIDCCHDFQCSLPQYETERILEEWLCSLGGSVERGVAAAGMERTGDGVRVDLRHADGREEVAEVDIAICAAGSHHGPMGEPLEGSTYDGRFVVADVRLDPPLPGDRSNVVCGPHGILLLSPLPGGRWISFQDVPEGATIATATAAADGVEARMGGCCRPADVAWFAEFRAHRRMAKRLSDGRRFLIGDAAHLSSPFGGEGLNAGLQDAFNLAWKVALVLNGRAKPTLLDAYAIERGIADRHVVETSDGLHRGFIEAAEALRVGRDVPGAGDPVSAALKNARAMIDFDYAGSPLIAAAPGPDPRPGQRYLDWVKLGADSHTVLTFGKADADSLGLLARRWSGLVNVRRDPDLDPARAGVPGGGTVLVRPDGHIAFRAAAADADSLTALDQHLASYLIPETP